MEVLYISSVPSKKQFDYMHSMLKKSVESSNYGMHESGFKFHHLILDGITKENNVYSLIGRPTSFKNYKHIRWPKTIEYEKNITYDHIGYLNLPIIKNIIISIKYFFKTLKWIKLNKDKEKCIILDASYITVIPFLNLATKIKKCKKVAIVCDIYEYMAPVKDARKNSKFFHKLIAKFMRKQYSQIDGFVFLTEQMNNVLNLQYKPFIVMEGLVDHNMNIMDNSLKNKVPKNIIMYAGALREQYGVKNLVEGFMEYNDKKAELWLFGAGDYAIEINKMLKKDKRIKFFGIVDNNEVIKKECEATLLINPRPINQEFTKYSFPSKNMEYMVSGTPILTTKLPGMPKEYYDYVYLINGNEKQDIINSLQEIFQYSKNELHKKGKQAKEFVLKYKNNIHQSNRIIKLCKEVCDYE